MFRAYGSMHVMIQQPGNALNHPETLNWEMLYLQSPLWLLSCGYRILIMQWVKPEEGTTMETIGIAETLHFTV